MNYKALEKFPSTLFRENILFGRFGDLDTFHILCGMFKDGLSNGVHFVVA